MASTRTNYDVIVLAGDIGGTNTNLALIGKKGGTFTLIEEGHYKTKEEPSLVEPLGRFLEQAGREHPGLTPELCCISGAGPVVEGRIVLTNAPWAIESAAIQSAFSIPTTLINDFTAVSYGVLLLDPTNAEQITRLPHGDGSLPSPLPGVRVVVGAGTGLGVGYIVKVRNRIEAFPSEGGHVTLPVYDDETRGLQRWLEAKYGFVPGAEAGVSGQGIGNIFAYLAEREAAAGNLAGPAAKKILESPEGDRPALIAQAAGSDIVCAKSMDMFVKLYARVCADQAATFLPAGGVFLAGGIAAKNEDRFLEGGRFMSMFERSYAKHIRTILAKTPVMIVKDYSISLYGAANAAVEMA
jgi:glucokinase